MAERHFVYQNANGVRRTAIADNETPGRLVVHTEQDVEPILNSIHRDREIMPNSGHNKLVCRIPTFVYEDLVHRGIAGDEDLFKAWLNSPEAEPWRIWKGSV